MTTIPIEKRNYMLSKAVREEVVRLILGGRVWVDRPEGTHKYAFGSAIQRAAKHHGVRVAIHSMKLGQDVLVERIA